MALLPCCAFEGAVCGGGGGVVVLIVRSVEASRFALCYARRVIPYHTIIIILWLYVYGVWQSDTTNRHGKVTRGSVLRGK